MGDTSDHCCVGFVVFVIVLAGVVVQGIAAFNFSSIEEFCGFNMSDNSTEFEEGTLNPLVYKTFITAEKQRNLVYMYVTKCFIHA